MTTAVYAGSFDPLTYGHLDILKTGSEIFDKLIIAVAHNPEKKSFIPVNDRVNLIKECVLNLKNVEVSSFEGLTVDFAEKHNASVLLRGVRNEIDFHYENNLAQVNYSLNKNIKTIIVPAKPEHSFISSSCVRELASHKCNLSKYVPDNIAEYIKTLVSD